MLRSNAQASGDVYPPSRYRDTGHISSHSHDHGARLRLPSFGSTYHCGRVTSIGRPHSAQGSPDAARLRTYCKTARRALPFFQRAPAVIRPPRHKKRAAPVRVWLFRVIAQLTNSTERACYHASTCPILSRFVHVTLLIPRIVDLNPFESMKSSAISSLR